MEGWHGDEIRVERGKEEGKGKWKGCREMGIFLPLEVKG